MEAPRATLRMIAEQAGVTISTVSRALRDDPQVAGATLRKIKTIAAKMHYVPDPALVALASYRSGMRKNHQFGKLAILCHRRENEGCPPHLQGQITGFQMRARELGFEGEVFQIYKDEEEEKRLSRILYYRGIRGVMVTTLPWLPTAFDWGKFSVMAVGENAVPLGLSYVSYDHDEAIRETFQQLLARKYKRIGYANLDESEARNRHLCMSAYLKYTYLAGMPTFPPLLYKSDEEDRIIPWIRKHKIDCLIGSSVLIRRLQRAGYAVPGDIGVAGFTTPSDNITNLDFSSYQVDYARLGAAASEFLQTMINKNQCGIPSPESRYAMLLRGAWHDGKTIRTRSA